jgi:hypothetical protein
VCFSVVFLRNLQDRQNVLNRPCVLSDIGVLRCLQGTVHAVAERCSFNEHLTSNSSCFWWQAAVAERLVAPFVDALGVCTIARQQKQVLRSSYFALYEALHLKLYIALLALMF